MEKLHAHIKRKAVAVTLWPVSRLGGIERYNIYLRDLLSSYGTQLNFYCLDSLKLNMAEKICARLIPGLKEFLFLSRAVEANASQYDFVITHNLAGGGLKTGRIPVYAVFHGLYASALASVDRDVQHRFGNVWKRQCLKHLEGMAVRRPKELICVSRDLNRQMRLLYDIPSSVVNNCIDISHFKKRPDRRTIRSKLGIAENDFVGIYAGRWDPIQKAVDILVDVMHSRNDVKWIVASDAADVPRGIENMVVLDRVGYEELPTVYSAADFALQLSRYEGFSYFTLEACACALPIITTAFGGARDILEEANMQSLLIPSPRKTSQFVKFVNERIDRLKRDHTYRETAGNRLREITAKGYSMSVWKEEMARKLSLEQRYAPEPTHERSASECSS